MPNRLVVLVCLVFHKIPMGLDCKFFEFPFLMCFFGLWLLLLLGLFVCLLWIFPSYFLVFMHVQNSMPSRNTSHSYRAVRHLWWTASHESFILPFAF